VRRLGGVNDLGGQRVESEAHVQPRGGVGEEEKRGHADRAIGSAKRATMAGADVSRTMPNATPVTIPVVRWTADWPIKRQGVSPGAFDAR
jgi:hypothetical protein